MRNRGSELILKADVWAPCSLIWLPSTNHPSWHESAMGWCCIGRHQLKKEQDMRTIVSSLCAVAMTLTALVGPAAISSAAPLNLPRIEAGPSSDVLQVRDRRFRRHFNGHRRFNRDSYLNRSHFYRHSGRGYYHGYRGYRYRRPGYRYYNGFYFPGSAFIAGAVIGDVLAAPHRRVVRRHIGGHAAACYNRYRSYRASDNTYQPYSGPRRQCVLR